MWPQMVSVVLLQPVLFGNDTLISVDLQMITDMQCVFFCENIAVVDVFDIGVDKFGNTSDFLAVHIDCLTRTAVLLGLDVEILILITDFEADHFSFRSVFPDFQKGVLADEILVPVNILFQTDFKRIGMVQVTHVIETGFGRQRPREDLEFGEGLLKSLEEISTTNMTSKRLAEELVQMKDYEILEVDHPAGEYQIGEDGYVEFHMEEGAAVEWVLEHLYTLQP